MELIMHFICLQEHIEKKHKKAQKSDGVLSLTTALNVKVLVRRTK